MKIIRTHTTSRARFSWDRLECAVYTLEVVSGMARSDDFCAALNFRSPLELARRIGACIESRDTSNETLPLGIARLAVDAYLRFLCIAAYKVDGKTWIHWAFRHQLLGHVRAFVNIYNAKGAEPDTSNVWGNTEYLSAAIFPYIIFYPIMSTAVSALSDLQYQESDKNIAELDPLERSWYDFCSTIDEWRPILQQTKDMSFTYEHPQVTIGCTTIAAQYLRPHVVPEDEQRLSGLQDVHQL